MADQNRTVRFELHILPMFRRLDHDHMLAVGPVGLDLFDPATYYSPDGTPKMDFIRIIAKHLDGELGRMPPVDVGGPWPDEWIALFKRWVSEGCPRLELGKGQYRAKRIGATEVQLSGMVDVLGEGYNVWFSRRNDVANVWSYDLYVEPPPAATGSSTSMFPKEDIRGIPASVTSIKVIDGTGEHTVSITGDPVA